jgi:hypothetical protein
VRTGIARSGAEDFTKRDGEARADGVSAEPLWIRPIHTDFLLEDPFAGLAYSIVVFIPFLVDFSG